MIYSEDAIGAEEKKNLAGEVNENPGESLYECDVGCKSEYALRNSTCTGESYNTGVASGSLRGEHEFLLDFGSNILFRKAGWGLTLVGENRADSTRAGKRTPPQNPARPAT